jgi:hypothetical protein
VRRWLVVVGVSLAIALVISAVGAWAIRWLAVDDCLDRSGRWNAASRTCSFS